jgi:hypothetical protein
MSRIWSPLPERSNAASTARTRVSLVRVGILSLANALQGLFAPHPPPSVDPRFGLPRRLPAHRRPETWDSPPTLLPEGADRSIRLTAHK